MTDEGAAGPEDPLRALRSALVYLQGEAVRLALSDVASALDVAIERLDRHDSGRSH